MPNAGRPKFLCFSSHFLWWLASWQRAMWHRRHCGTDLLPNSLHHTCAAQPINSSFQKLYLCICVCIFVCICIIIGICIFLSGFLRCCQTLPIIPAPPSHLIFLQIEISQVSRLFPRALKYHRLSKTTCRGVALIGRRPRLIRLCPRHKLMDDTEQSWMRRYIDHQPTN